MPARSRKKLTPEAAAVVVYVACPKTHLNSQLKAGEQPARPADVVLSYGPN